MRLYELKNKKILILGLGKEGSDTLAFLRKCFPKKILGAADILELKQLKPRVRKFLKKDRKIKRLLGKNYLKALKRYDVIIKSPGIPPKVIKPFLSKRQKVTSQTEIFFKNCPGKIVGITATKGKSTTTSLIYKILKGGGIKAHLVGNIGKPVLNLLLSAKASDVYVYELSSHQLLNLKKSPHVAVFLNIFPEHLDYYRSFKEYAQAKANITFHQKKDDFLVFNSKNEIVRKIVQSSRTQKRDLNSVRIEKVIRSKDIPLRGKFNLQNVKAAISVGRIFNVPDKKIAKAIKKFKPLHHRLELVGTFKGITFYNDALATIPESTIEAIEAFDDNVQTIFLGGFDRGLDFKKLAKKVLESKIKTVILFPTTGERIWKEIEKLGKKKLPKHFFVNNMSRAVRIAYQETKRGICLLSTASPSFSIFRDYKQKGNLFKKYVRKYGKGS
jgi:UDP-N-acetylmuramoylalanine--D-glutamate ligase